LWAYSLGKGRNAVAIREIGDRSTAAADTITQRIRGEAYGNTLLRKNYIWGSNGIAANYSLQLLIADRLSPNRQFREAAAANLDYLFGRSPFSLSFVTGLGTNSVKNIHHRPSAGLKLPWPGLFALAGVLPD
jgi:endoglucanase